LRDAESVTDAGPFGRRPPDSRIEDVYVKKLLLTALAAVGGALAFKKYKDGREEEDLWAEATDPVR